MRGRQLTGDVVQTEDSSPEPYHDRMCSEYNGTQMHAQVTHVQRACHALRPGSLLLSRHLLIELALDIRLHIVVPLQL